MKSFAYLVLIVSISVLSSAAQVPGYTEFRSPGKYTITLADNRGTRVSCLISIVDYSPKMQRTGWWGADADPTAGVPARTIIDGISFKVGNTRFDAPLSSYADLANPDRAKIEKVGKHYRLMMDGSDAAYGYRATIGFDNWHVTERTVEDGEFPESSSERTTYHVDTTAVGQ